MKDLVRNYTHTALLSALLFCSLGFNWVLGSRLKTTQKALEARTSLVEGEEWPVSECIAASGEVLRISDGKQPTIVYWFSPHCRFCDMNVRNAKVLAAATQKQYRFIGVSAEDAALPKYIQTQGIAFRTCKIAVAVGADARLRGTPMTIVINKAGRVARLFKGAYSEAVKRDIERYFGTALPDTIEAPQVPTRAGM